MENVQFSQSAFKHGATEADIRKAFDTKQYDAELDGEDFKDKNLLIGFDRNASLIEVMYNAIDNDTARVFHAMKCRKTYVELLEEKGTKMKDLTEKEYDELDEFVTKTTPEVKANGTGFISRREVRLMGLSDLSVDYLLTKSEATKKTPAQIIDDLVHEKLAVSA
jgi:hypothetical protein